MVQIEILTGPESGRLVDVDSGIRTFGRAAGCDIVLSDGSVSGRHLEIQVDSSGAVRFRDLGSTNGTWSGGVQVQEGEWFTGSELKLGGCALRLLDPASAGAATSASAGDEDADLHRRAREAALSGGRKGGLLQLLAVLVVVAGGGTAAWWFLGGGGDGDGEGGRRGTSNAGGPTVELDLIDDLGDFSSPESWSQTPGIEIAEGKLRGGTVRGRATLTREFSGAAALRFSGQTQGTVIPIVSWGSFGDDTADGEWAAPALTAAAAELALPAGADWFRLALDVAAGAEVSAFKVEEGAASVRTSTAPAGSVRSTAGNWLLRTAVGGSLTVRGAAGAWQSVEGGEQYTSDGPSELLVSASDDLLRDGVFLILASGGPVGLAAGVVIEDSPGLLLGDETGRYLFRFDPPATVRAADGGARVTLQGGATLRWGLRADLTEAARISRAIQDHERNGDDRALQIDVARLLRDYPLVDPQVADALQRSRASLERGRSELQTLQTGTAAALFIASLQSMITLQERAESLVARFPGTEVETGAQELVVMLSARTEEIRASAGAEAAAYRVRLQLALKNSYPMLADWLEMN